MIDKLLIYCQYGFVLGFFLCSFLSGIKGDYVNVIGNIALVGILFTSFFGFNLYPKYALIIVNLSLFVFNAFTFRSVLLNFSPIYLLQNIGLVVIPLILAIIFTIQLILKV